MSLSAVPQRPETSGLNKLSSLSTIGDMDDSVGGGGRQHMAVRWRRAARHSRFVRVLRIALPASIAIILIAIVGLTFFNPFRLLKRLPIDPGKVVISGTTITMASPRVAGFTRDQRAYDLSARAASQDITKPNLLTLQDLRAKVALQDNAEVEMTAVSGVFDRGTEKLTLNDKILLTSTTGYEARLTRAVIDVKSGNIVSQDPVKVKLLNGTLDANRLNIDDKGDVVRFGGGVTMNLILVDAAAKKAAAQP
jgi:lipopolysaccharide export system protein LptC